MHEGGKESLEFHARVVCFEEQARLILARKLQSNHRNSTSISHLEKHLLTMGFSTTYPTLNNIEYFKHLACHKQYTNIIYCELKILLQPSQPSQGQSKIDNVTRLLAKHN